MPVKVKKLKVSLTIGATIGLLGIFICFLIISIYYSRMDLQQEILNGHKSYTSEVAWSVAYFFESRKSELKQISYGSEVRHYLNDNQDTQSKEAITSLMNKIIREKVWGPDNIYERIIFSDSLGNVICDTENSLTGQKWKNFEDINLSGKTVDTFKENGIFFLTISIPCSYNGKIGGLVTAFIRTDIIRQKLTILGIPAIYGICLLTKDNEILLTDKLNPDRRMAIKIDPASVQIGQTFNISAKSAENSNEKLIAVSIPIKDTTLSLLNIIDSNVLLKGPQPWQIFTALAALTVFVLGGGYYSIRSNVETAAIKAKLDEKANQYSLVVDKNLELANEITQRQRAQLEAERAKDAAERLNKQLKEALEREKLLTKKAEIANIAKSEFLANMSHELKTPLQGILGFSEFGLEKYGSADNETLKTYFEHIYTSGKNLHKLISEVLTLASLDAGKMEFSIQPCSLTMAAAMAAEEFSEEISKKDIDVRFDGLEFSEKVMADADKLGIVVRNIMSNAVKFCPEKGIISISIKRKTDVALLSISDNGPGIPSDELVKIFDKFEQSSKTKNGSGGKGLGLSICKEIIRAHNGKIWAENIPDGGARFYIELAIAPVAAKNEDTLKYAVVNGA